MLTLSSIYLLISNALQNRRILTIFFSRSVMITLFIFSIMLGNNSLSNLFLSGLSLYGGLFFIKNYIIIFTQFIFNITSLILGLTSYYPRKIIISNTLTANKTENTNKIEINGTKDEEKSTYKYIFINKDLEQYKILEYSLLILFVISGAILLMSCNDLISIFLCIELQSYGLYLLCAVYRNSELSSKASLTYFLLGGLSSCIILLGQSLIYINTGNTNLDGLFVINNISNQINYISAINSDINNVYQYNIQTSLVIFSVGFLFKISSAPFHNWSPDVYDQIPTLVTTFVAIIAKISILIMFFELIFYTNNQLNTSISWKNNILLSALLSLIIGSVLGLTQTRIKRLYAYSTISHLGFILLSLSVLSVESTMAFFFYIIQYSITNLNAFLILISIGYSLFIYKSETNHKKLINKTLIIRNETKKLNQENENNRNYSPIQYVNELSDYYKVNTYLALSLGLTLFSFLGVPPLMGFFGKQMVLSAALDRGYVFMVLIAIITSVISAVYYLIIIKVIFFENNNRYINIHTLNSKNVSLNYINFDKEKITLNSHLSNTISLINLIILQFIFISKGKISLFLLLSLFNLQ